MNTKDDEDILDPTYPLQAEALFKFVSVIRDLGNYRETWKIPEDHKQKDDKK